jgi:hypothetical protein
MNEWVTGGGQGTGRGHLSLSAYARDKGEG